MDGPRTSSKERVQSTRYRALGAGLTTIVFLAACAHAQPKTADASASSFEAPAMPASDTFKPSPASDYPDITPKEMGQRFLRLVDGLRSIDELSPERVTEATRLPMRYAPAGKLYSFTLHEPKTGWYYALDYYQSPGLGKKTASLEFSHPSAADADMAPVCGMDFDSYTSALKALGFTQTDTRDELGRVLAYRFYRGEIRVDVMQRYQARASQQTLEHLCVEAVSVHGAD